ncbi:tetratricopeptide repeat protein [bacterium]|nr:tetratricopeptide repeat protein [bacterium]
MEIIYPIAGIALFLIVVALYIRSRKKSSGRTPYIDALHLLLDGKKDEALDRLKQTVRTDTENIMAYVRLGILFREKGLPLRAAKIHRNLLVRSNLKDEDVDIILHQLVLDYEASGTLDRAITVAERLVQRNKKNVDSQKLLLGLLERKNDWDKAFFARQGVNRWTKKKDSDILALYKVQSGLALMKKGQQREGRIRFREALKLDKRCIPAYLYWGDSYRAEKRDEDALKVWHQFMQKNPQWSHFVFDRMKNVLYDLGRYGEMEEIYKDIIRKKPQNLMAYIHLIEIYGKQNRIDEALALCEGVIEKHPDCKPCQHARILLLQQKGLERESLNAALAYIESDLEKASFYWCRKCGYETAEPLWRCPQCQAWKSFLVEE